MLIISISDSPNLFSGLARVHRHIIDALVAEGHQIVPCVWFGYDEFVTKQVKDRQIKPPPLYYNSNGTEIQMFTIPKRNNYKEVTGFFDVVTKLKPDLILTIGDPIDFYYMKLLKMKSGYGFKWFPYLTIETDDIKDDLVPVLEYADTIAVPTNYGKMVLEKYVDKPISVVPYGVDKVFQRLPEKERLELRRERKCEDKVRFITVAQNTSRKNLPGLLQAISLISKDTEKNLEFYIHTNLYRLDSQEQCLFDLKKLVSKLGVEKLVKFPEDGISMFSAPKDEILLKEYNASDWFILPSIAEGYGLPGIEAMKCGLPLLASNTSTMTEHLGAKPEQFGQTPRGWAVENRIEVLPPAQFIRIPRQDSLGQRILEVSQFIKDEGKKEELEEMRSKCMEYAGVLTWERTGKEIVEIIGNMKGSTEIPVEII